MYRRSLKFSIALFFTLGLTSQVAFGVSSDTSPKLPAIADRIVVVINNLPYSQLEIERYINSKECLRDDAGKSQVVQNSNWNLALDAFISDMSIHQEASKSSGFRPTKDAVEKLRVRCENMTKTAAQFKPAFERIGLFQPELENEILKILTVENYRHGKAALSKTASHRDSSPHSTWESELAYRTIIRYFDDAKTYQTISFGQ
jgi:hypothetical protein